MRFYLNTTYGQAVLELLRRLSRTLDLSKLSEPVRAVLAGGVAVHFLTGVRISDDIDAFFSHRLILPQDLEMIYRDETGALRRVWFDYNYNPYFGLLHPDAISDAIPLPETGLFSPLFQVCVLTPEDLAISKLSRFSERDREDIQSLIEAGLLIEASRFRQRAEEALEYYVGDTRFLEWAIERVETWISEGHGPDKGQDPVPSPSPSA